MDERDAVTERRLQHDVELGFAAGLFDYVDHFVSGFEAEAFVIGDEVAVEVLVWSGVDGNQVVFYGL
ncbi:MAG TPA: hypothetical protein VKC66_18390 [Xanthobacteraceae bacterium]|nr:hypothetical protein [Xanthobacteraceae bacterium]